MREDTYTEDFADICSCNREREILIRIMRAWGEQGLPDDFYDRGVRPAFNRSSGKVFLVNEDYQVCMLNGDSLECWYSSPHKGVEGFWEDLVREYPTMHPEDQEWMRQLAEAKSEEVPNAASE